MKGSLSDKQRIIRTTSDILWIMQFYKNVSKDDKQHILRITPQRSIGQLYG